MSGRPRWIEDAFVRVDGASIAFCRIAFGLLMAWEVVRYFTTGRIYEYYVRPTHHFTYYGFGWVQPLPEVGLYALFAVLGLAALGIAAGRLFRLSTSVFCAGFTYVFLLDQARYLNHFYLICLLSLLWIFMPRGQRVPKWSIWLLRFQVGIVYFYAGVAKCNADWLGGEPMRTWLAGRTSLPVLGTWFLDEWVVYLFSWGALALDLLAVPGLLYRPTRSLAYVGLSAFHLLNSVLFNIGVFPWMMLAMTTVFFAPSWPRALLGRSPVPDPRPGSTQRGVVWALILWATLQLTIPLRHFLYPGNVSWTEEGHRFAWHMLLRSKRGSARFVVRDPVSRRITHVDPSDDLVDWQASKMAGRPDMVLQYAHLVARRARRQAGHDVEVRAICRVAMNGRPAQDLIDPTVDLAKVERSLVTADWIVPLRPR